MAKSKTHVSAHPPDAKKKLAPDHMIGSLARCALPLIQAYHESEEGQREFAEWKARKEERERRG